MLLKFTSEVLQHYEQAQKCVRRAVQRVRHKIDPDTLASTVEAVVGSRRECIVLHSSLSRCGFIIGGASTVIGAIRSMCETTCAPTHTYCYPAPCGDEVPVYDRRTSESKVGQITNVFRSLPEGIRSNHPTHSLAAIGPLAQELCGGHELCKTPCGVGTPYMKLVERDAAVLMFGATMDGYTLFHTVEDSARCPYLYYDEPLDLKVIDDAGSIRTVKSRRHDMSVKRRFKSMDTVLEREGLLHRARLGCGELLFVASSRRVHEFLLAQFARDVYYLVDAQYRQAKGW